jgi:inositol phosphorylceramide mannosyltransferase catalytic subunit
MLQILKILTYKLKILMSLKQHITKPLNTGLSQHNLDYIEQGSQIPRIIHQTYFTSDLSEAFQENVNSLKDKNPGWQYKFYDDDAIFDFISYNYDQTVLHYYNRINPKYGAARADFFRYLVIYKEGGVYLDLKSNIDQPIDEILLPSDRYILAHWSNGQGEGRQNFGHWPELSHMPRGEFQQWHIIAVAGHPFLRKIILSIMNNIDLYKPWIHGVGQRGVLNLTGPIAYSLAILPLLNKYDHRIVGSDSDVGLSFNALKTSHLKVISKPHYRTQNDSVVLLTGYKNIVGKLYTLLRVYLKKLIS